MTNSQPETLASCSCRLSEGAKLILFFLQLHPYPALTGQLAMFPDARDEHVADVHTSGRLLISLHS